MPGFRAALTADQRWALIDAIRARNAGYAWRDTGAWPTPLRLPAFDVACPRTGVATTDDLRGRSLYVVVPREGSVAVLRPPSRRGVGWTRCSADDPAVPAALALLLGQPAAGSRLLVDANGWLRMAKTGEAASEWDDPAALAAALAAIKVPLTGAGGGHHHG